MIGSLGEHSDHDDPKMPNRFHRTIEQWRLLVSNGITAADYYLYGLYRPNLSWRKKREFLGDYERWRWQMAVNPPTYHILTENKAIFNCFMRGAGIPVPRLHAVIGQTGVTELGKHCELRSKEQVRAWLRDEQIENVFLKPIMGSRGRRVLSLGRRLGDDEWQRLPSGIIRIDDLLQHLFPEQGGTAFVVEELLYPHPELAKFSAGVLHTARIITLLEDDVQVLAAALRIGTGTSPADNLSQGNLASPIDISSGVIGAAVTKKTTAVVRFSVHPVTGAKIEGTRVPDWVQCLNLLRFAGRKLSFTPILGWDVAFTARGPVVIEANDNWDPDATQIAHDEGLLATSLRTYFRHRGLLKKVGLGIGLA
jgi:hypothetical protein